VGGPAVELDDQALVGPEAVGLKALGADGDPGVEVGAGETVAVEEGDEPFLEGAAGAAGGFLEARERGPDCAAAAMARVSLQQVQEREGVVEPQVFRLAQGGLDGFGRLRRQVEDRARDGGDGDVVVGGDLVGREASEVA
jgi:hypothetical protein